MHNRRTHAVSAVALTLLVALIAVVRPAAADYTSGDILFVKKTAVGSSGANWTWTIDKSGDQSDLTLSTGQTQQVNYTVSVGAVSATGWSVEGTIQFRNKSDSVAVVTSVTDLLSNGTAGTVSCPFSFPFNLPSGWISPVCTYTAFGAGTPPTTNTASVNLNSGATFTSAAVAVNYTSVSETDECITVSDSLYGGLGTVCAGAAPFTFSYSLTVGPYDTCGLYQVHNTASFVTNDTGTAGEDSWTVNVNVPCAGGCTLTQGYWKTHSEFGPAPYDATWAMLSSGASTPFFLSGQTWHQVFWTPPAGGSRYYQLAHQFMAARLNILNGAASTPEVDAALVWATNFFNTYTPSSSLPSAVRNQASNYASLLDGYNNGVTGPGHCSE